MCTASDERHFCAAARQDSSEEATHAPGSEYGYTHL
jgi:hypothetical protein